MEEIKFEKRDMHYGDYTLTRWPALDPEKELLWHKGKHPLESWFIVSNLESGDQELALQVHFGVVQIGPKKIGDLNVSVTNLTTGQYTAKEFTYIKEKIELSTTQFEAKTKDMYFACDEKGVTCKVTLENAAIDLYAKREALPVLCCGTGYCQFIGKDQYDYGIPHMKTTGTITIEGQAFPITGGITWFDRQYGNLPMELMDKKKMDTMRWTWMNIQLENGESIIIFQSQEDESKRLISWATIGHTDGSVTMPIMEPIVMGDNWKSEQTGCVYPTQFILNFPEIGTQLHVDIPYKNQEIISQITSTKLEGAANVTGIHHGKPIKGKTFVELVGSWK